MASNTTSPPPSIYGIFALPNYVAVPAENPAITAVESYIAAHSKGLEAIATIMTYAPLLTSALHYLTPSGPKRVRQLYNWNQLASHILIGLYLVARYQYAVYFSVAPPTPPTVDCALAFANGVLAWSMTKRLVHWNPRLLRGTFHGMSLSLMLSSVMAYTYDSPAWYRYMARSHDVFLFARYIGIMGVKLKAFNNFRDAIGSAIWLSALTLPSTPLYGFFGGPFVMIISFISMGLCNFIADKTTLENSKSNPLIRLALYIGLVEVSTYKRLRQKAAAAQDGQPMASENEKNA